jgi:DNA segregation ATPase FtsK/SpoIIIE, S-DNA-T family
VRGYPVTTFVVLVLVLVPLALVVRGTWAIWRFARLAPAAKRNYLIAVWARARWRWLARNQGLAYLDNHRRRVFHPSVGTAVRVRVNGRTDRAWLRYPRARFRADEFGIVAKVRTVPRSAGRKDFEEAAPYLADAWRCVRVQVTQPKPGRIILRGLRRDPLLEPFTIDQAPAGAFDPVKIGKIPFPLKLYMGIDAWAQHRWISLPGVTGITVAGLPGRGKTELIKSLVAQLEPLPAKFAFIDGKSSHLPTSDYSEFEDRAEVLTGDDPEAAADALNEIYQEMRRRFTKVLELTGGKKNAWHVGPTNAMPLYFTVLDEVATFFNMDQAKGDKRKESYVQACRTLAGHLVGKGRSVLMLTATLSQKQDNSATNLAVRDNSGISVCFGVKTIDAAVSALGASIRDYPSLSPVALQDDAYVGCCVTTLPTGSDPYTVLRVPELTVPAAAWRRANHRQPAGV